MKLVALHSVIAALLAVSLLNQETKIVVRPKEIGDVLVNPGMGIQTFQRFQGDAIYSDLQWSERGPEDPLPLSGLPQSSATQDFPGSSLAYVRWFWDQIEPAPGKYRWEIIDRALEQARQRGQALDLRIMPYDQKNPLPEWYRNSGARRANKPTDADGGIWSPDADDPLYLERWGNLMRVLGQRYDGHPDLNSVDISTVGYWGEGWGPYLPARRIQKALIDIYFEVFKTTSLLMNFDEPTALAYGVGRGAGWRLDCWGDLGGRGRGMMHMLDLYPQQVVRTGIQHAWERAPVSLETCGTPGSWKKWGYGQKELEYNFAQALRWHASSINIKSTAIPSEWKGEFQEFQKKLGYRLILRKLEYPSAVKAGGLMTIEMWWLNSGSAPVYREYWLAIELHSPNGSAVIRTPADVRKWLPGDALYEGQVRVPQTLPSGEYHFRLALLDPRTARPAIRLGIEGRQADGWYDLGMIQVQR